MPTQGFWKFCCPTSEHGAKSLELEPETLFLLKGSLVGHRKLFCQLPGSHGSQCGWPACTLRSEHAPRQCANCSERSLNTLRISHASGGTRRSQAKTHQVSSPQTRIDHTPVLHPYPYSEALHLPPADCSLSFAVHRHSTLPQTPNLSY